jgi:hypothetical protein
MLHGRPHLVRSIGAFTERLLIHKRNILTRVFRLSSVSPPKPQVSNPSSTLHGVSDSDFSISDTTGLFALVDRLARDHSYVRFCQRFGIERDN